MSRDASTTLTVLTQTFDILGRVCMARHPDSGAKLIWRDVASQTLRSWDSPNTVDERSQSFTYDALRRPTERWVRLRSPNGDISSLAEETTYGESLTDAKARNARGQAFSHKDGAGIATDEQRDFQGKVTRSVRQLTTSTTKDVPDWSKSVTLDETFTTLTAYDALGRVIQIDTPHNQSVPASQVFPIYNEANLLERVEANLRGATTRTTFVQNIDYDAKGQRQRITYGNGATTRYQYDPLTWRLTNLLTTRNGGTDTLQNLSYTYDPTGNVVQITDDAQQTVFFNNQVVTATTLYEYDALYRLTQSTGREHINNGDATEPEAEGFNSPQNLPSDGQSLRNYTRSWTYDHVGNILSLIHTATGGNWTRNYTYASDSNRLAATTVGAVTQTYTHNAHGSFTAMPHLDAMDWTPDERLLHVKRGTSQTWYTYDSTGQRVRKVTEKGGFTEERLYLGAWEIYRKRQGTTVTLERETLHLMDGARRIAMVETKTVDASSTSALPTTVTRYQLDNHLQSASLELDETASVISYEEYYPYGDTSYRSAKSGVEVSEKRYRYTGKEKDEETGLYYHGARYYAAWLGRWTAADPAGMVDGACLYAYVRNHPTGLVDPDGRASENSAIIDYEHRTEDPNQYYGGRGFNLPPIPPGFRFEAPQTTKTLSDEQIEIIMQHGYRDDPTWNCFDEAKTAVVNAAALEDPKSVLFDSNYKIGYNWVGAPTIPDDQFDLTMEKSPSENMIDYIVKSINKGKPLLAGVNHQQSLLNSKGKPLNEGGTDHWISIYGYKSQQGQITHILAIDNATTNASKIEFSVDPATMEAEKPATDENSRFAADLRFEITQIRLWKGIEPKSKLHQDGYRGK